MLPDPGKATFDRRQVMAVLGAVGAVPSGAIAAMAQDVTAGAARGVPRGAVDCHVHVLDPERFSYVPDRSYTPGPATLADLQAFHAKLGVTRAVLVQPSVYGTDNACLLEALGALGPETARGVAVVDPASVADAELDRLGRAGVVGLRVNLNVKGEARVKAAVDAVSRTVARAAPHGLAVQIYVDLPLVEALAETIAAAPVPVVLDHFGGARSEGGVDQPGFATLLRLLAAGDTWVKLSAPYRSSTQAPDYADMEPIVRALVAANPHNLVWASDWPHTGGGAERQGRKATDVEPFRQVDDAHTLGLLPAWSGRPDIDLAILTDNAAKLFRF